MNREILFRAKRVNWKELPEEKWWVEGWLLQSTETRIATSFISENKNEEDVMVASYRVDPETVCQYTGLTDKNDKEIFEGDIIKIHQFLFDGCEYDKEIIVFVEYMEDVACFGANLLQAKEIRAYMGYDNETEKEEKVVVPLCNFNGLHEESFEVIGNMYDNADLLKEAGNE